jgi:hypothetical protein
MFGNAKKSGLHAKVVRPRSSRCVKIALNKAAFAVMPSGLREASGLPQKRNPLRPYLAGAAQTGIDHPLDIDHIALAILLEAGVRARDDSKYLIDSQLDVG